MDSKILAAIATTNAVKVADSEIALTTDALLSAAHSINSQASAPVALEHDPYTVPMMKTGHAYVEYGEEYDRLVIEILESEQSRMVTSDTETEYDFLRFPVDSLPFKRQEHSDQLSVSADLANFDTVDRMHRFEESVSRDGTHMVHMGRYSIVPEPIIVLSGTVITGLVLLLLLKPFYTGYSNAVSKLMEQLVTKTVTFFAQHAIATLNRKTQDVLKSFSQHKSLDERPILVERVLTSEDVNLVFLERVSECEDLRDLELQEILEILLDLGDVVLAADQIKLVRTDDSTWQLWYLHTKDGHVIATDEAMDYTSNLLDRMTREVMQKRQGEEE